MPQNFHLYVADYYPLLHPSTVKELKSSYSHLRRDQNTIAVEILEEKAKLVPVYSLDYVICYLRACDLVYQDTSRCMPSRLEQIETFVKHAHVPFSGNPKFQTKTQTHTELYHKTLCWKIRLNLGLRRGKQLEEAVSELEFSLNDQYKHKELWTELLRAKYHLMISKGDLEGTRKVLEETIQNLQNSQPEITERWHTIKLLFYRIIQTDGPVCRELLDDLMVKYFYPLLEQEEKEYTQLKRSHGVAAAVYIKHRLFKYMLFGQCIQFLKKRNDQYCLSWGRKMVLRVFGSTAGEAYFNFQEKANDFYNEFHNNGKVYLSIKLFEDYDPPFVHSSKMCCINGPSSV